MRCVVRTRLVSLLLVFAGCGRPAVAPPATVAATTEQLGAELAIARHGCVRCHVATGNAATRLAAEPGPPLAEAVRFHAAGMAPFLRRHHGGDAAEELAAWVAALGAENPAPRPVDIAPAALARGEALFRQLACAACHAEPVLSSLATRTDHTRLSAFLQRPASRRPGLLHVDLSAAEAGDLAAWLLRAQAGSPVQQPGFRFACWERRIDEATAPDLHGVEPVASGISDHIGADLGHREHHFVLRFDATLDVPAAGEWRFTTGSDDSSWLWIDGELVVQNEGLAPHRRERGTVELTAGPHDLRVLYTQAAGGRSLEVLWRGPGTKEEVIPAARATAAQLRLSPPEPPPVPAADVVARGRAAARQRRCDACHAFDDAAFFALPPPSAAPFAELGAGACPMAEAASSLHAGLGEVSQPRSARENLEHALLADRCLACHGRAGQGGLPPVARSGLHEIEDLGDEGRLPPDLTAVGRRLRQPWLERVLRDGHSVRPYLRVRMPRLLPERARDYAAWFAEVDGTGVVDDEPVFDVDAVQRGRQLVGQGGRNCITCHSCQGNSSLGPQGMDLAVQAERLRPAWLRDWLLQPQKLRPGTRMPTLWFRGDAADRQEVEAIVTWLSLGGSAPLPSGLRTAADSLRLEPIERPVLHGAFLHGVSARCLCVGTPERAHFAFDLTALRLCWLWRGPFLDAAGTWSGRAGKLLRPLGSDWIVLDDVAVGGGEPRRLLAQQVHADGYPTLRIGVGALSYEDSVRPRLAAPASELVRTLRAVRGPLVFEFPPAAPPLTVTVNGQAAGRHELATGSVLEVVYRW